MGEVLFDNRFDARRIDEVVEDGARIDVDRRSEVASIPAAGAQHLNVRLQATQPNVLVEKPQQVGTSSARAMGSEAHVDPKGLDLDTKLGEKVIRHRLALPRVRRSLP